MGYTLKQPALVSRIVREQGGKGSLELLPFNGTYVRSNRGEVLFKRTKHNVPQIIYGCEVDGKRFFGAIKDPILIERIVQYREHYCGKKYTNCAAFAHFLTTGRFVECSDEKNLLVLEQGMRFYSGQKFDIGDMVCVLYANERFMRSRKNLHRPEYMKVQKARHEKNVFGNSIKHARNVYEPALLQEIVTKDIRIADYHFMVCAAKHNGEPVWVSQWGYSRPGEHMPPIVVTVGKHDGYMLEVPFSTLIKKRRR